MKTGYYLSMQFPGIPEAQNRFSPALAKEIGLEAAVMLCSLADGCRTSPAQDFKGYRWYLMELEQLEFLFPFWEPADIQRISLKLQDLGYLYLDGNYLDSQRLHFAFNSEPLSQSENSSNSSRTTRTKAHVLDSDWQPDPEGLSILTRHSIPDQFIKGCIAEFVYDAREKNQPRDDWNGLFRKKVLQKWRRQEADFLPEDFTHQQHPMNRDWTPGPDAMDIFERSGIPREFVFETLPEFILYWQEKGVSRNTWNHDFVKHVRQQWAQRLNILEHNATPQPIPEQWQPSADVLEVLRMANIPLAFAERQIAEFILYWRERAELHNNWGYKFIQHIKRQWAKENEKQQRDSAKSTAEQDFVELHTDSSWADDL